MPADLLHVVEAAYQLELDDASWLQGLTNAIGPLLDDGFGVYGATIDASQPQHMRVADVVSYRGQPIFVDAIYGTAAAMTAPEVKVAYRHVRALTTATERFGARAWSVITAAHGLPDVGDCAAVLATDPRGVGCMVIAPLRRAQRYSLRVRNSWARVVAHVVALHRLRYGVRQTTGDRNQEGEAVLSPTGKLEHAVGAATEKSARTLLREAALLRETARGRVRRRDPEAAVEMWRALVAGRWSIVDRFDRDGRRFLIAHENEPHVAEPRALTARERQVVTYAAIGHSNKLMAYELGISVGSVSAYLTQAMRKLGISSRVDLARPHRLLSGS